MVSKFLCVFCLASLIPTNVCKSCYTCYDAKKFNEKKKDMEAYKTPEEPCFSFEEGVNATYSSENYNCLTVAHIVEDNDENQFLIILRNYFPKKMSCDLLVKNMHLSYVTFGYKIEKVFCELCPTNLCNQRRFDTALFQDLSAFSTAIAHPDKKCYVCMESTESTFGDGNCFDVDYGKTSYTKSSANEHCFSFRGATEDLDGNFVEFIWRGTTTMDCDTRIQLWAFSAANLQIAKNNVFCQICATDLCNYISPEVEINGKPLRWQFSFLFVLCCLTLTLYSSLFSWNS